MILQKPNYKTFHLTFLFYLSPITNTNTEREGERVLQNVVYIMNNI